MFDRGLVLCSSRINSHVYNSQLCDLTKEMKVNDTLVYTAKNHLFSTQVKRFVTPYIV